MKYLLILLTALVFTSCETNWGRYGGYKMDYQSAVDYYIVLDKGDIIYESDTNEEQQKKGTLVKFHRASGKVDSVWGGNGGMVIDPYIDDDWVVFDSSFILVGQKPLDSVCECNYSCLFREYPNYNDLPTYQMCVDSLEASTYFQYWIIDKTRNAIYGPFSKSQFVTKRQELGVSDSLIYHFPEGN